MLGIRFKTFLSLKAVVIVGFCVFWGAGFQFGRYLGGGDVKGSFEPIALKTVGITCAFACLFFLSVASLKKAQAILVAPSRSNDFRPREFYLLAFVTFVLASFYLFVEV
ncbi:MAG: hypothetical protein AAF902_06485 [Chloroflexota bacterium]